MNAFGELMHLNERSCKLRELHTCKLFAFLGITEYKLRELLVEPLGTL